MSEEKAAVLVVVHGGVAYAYAGDFVDVQVLDFDDHGEKVLPNTEAFRQLAEQAEIDTQVAFDDETIDTLSALADCITQMEQCSKMLRDDEEFQGALFRARAAYHNARRAA